MTTGAPEQSLEQSRERVPGWVAWLVTPLVVVLLGSSLDLVDQVAPETLGGVSARYVPPEGHRTVILASDGVETVIEHSRSTGVEGVLAAPTIVSATLLDALGEAEVRRAQWWRATRATSAGERATDLHRLTSDGIVLTASWGGGLGLLFEPELLLLPADARPGDAWSSSGSALADGALTYTAESTAFAATGPFTGVDGVEVPLTGGCLGVDSVVRISSAEDDLQTTLIESTVWCPGRGAVWSSGSVDDQPVGQAELRPGALPASAASEAVEAWRDAAATAADLGAGRTLPLTIPDPFFGDSAASGQFPARPAATPDGRLVTANERGDDVQVWRLESGAAVLDWAGHPGGAVVAVGAVGDLIVATTAQRRVVAYDGLGRRLWSWGADELVLSAPQALAISGSQPPAVLIAARSGTVTALDARTGAPRWSTSLGADSRAEPVVADGLVLVADERERLTALDGATGAVLWRIEPGLVDALAAADGSAAALLDSGRVVGLDLASGVERFDIGLPGLARGLRVEAGVVVALTDERAAGLDAASGLERWRAEGGAALAGEGAMVAVVRSGTVQLIDLVDGAVIAERPITEGAVGASRSALAIGFALVLLDTDGLLQRWELR